MATKHCPVDDRPCPDKETLARIIAERTRSTPSVSATQSPPASATVSSAPEPVVVSAEKASSAAALDPAPIVIIGGALLAAALVWFIRPVRAVLARIVSRKDAR